MDPLTLIVTALTAGAAAGMTDTASSAVKDAYNGLKDLVSKRLADRPGAEQLLARHEEKPATWRDALVAQLREAGAANDTELVAAARALLRLAGESKAQNGKYLLNARDVQGMQVGDHNRQANVFPPRGLRHSDGL